MSRVARVASASTDPEKKSCPWDRTWWMDTFWTCTAASCTHHSTMPSTLQHHMLTMLWPQWGVVPRLPVGLGDAQPVSHFLDKAFPPTPFPYQTNNCSVCLMGAVHLTSPANAQSGRWSLASLGATWGTKSWKTPQILMNEGGVWLKNGTATVTSE